jgi:hypothetical protein
MKKKILVNFFLWGILLWLFGYILGILFFFFVPPTLVGWAIMPFGIVATIFVLFKKIKLIGLRRYLILGLIWTLIAVIFDYFFLVQVFKPSDGYYKLDVYIYYNLTFFLPILVGLYKKRKKIADF